MSVRVPTALNRSRIIFSTALPFQKSTSTRFYKFLYANMLIDKKQRVYTVKISLPMLKTQLKAFKTTTVKAILTKNYQQKIWNALLKTYWKSGQNRKYTNCNHVFLNNKMPQTRYISNIYCFQCWKKSNCGLSITFYRVILEYFSWKSGCQCWKLCWKC